MTIEGKAKKENGFLSVEDILSKTNNGFDIYRFYLGDVKRSMKSPLRGDDKSPSFGVFYYNGLWFWKDSGKNGGKGNAIGFVQRYFSLDFKDACNKIVWDFGLKPDALEVKSSIITWEKPTEEEKSYCHISFVETKFDAKHAKYWNDYHLSEDYLKKYNVLRVKKLAINHQRIKLLPDELTFAYYHERTDSAKILRIGVPKEMKWRTNVPGDTLWFRENIKECSNLVISKSVKDSLCLSLFGINTVAVQSEDISCIEKNEDWLNSLSCQKYINFGTDEQGKEQSWKITEKYSYKHYNTPDNLLELGVNDPSEFCKHDIKAFEEHLKIKKYYEYKNEF